MVIGKGALPVEMDSKESVTSDILDEIRQLSRAEHQTERQAAAKMLGSLGGRARARVLSPGRRVAIGKMGASARWICDCGHSGKVHSPGCEECRCEAFSRAGFPSDKA